MKQSTTAHSNFCDCTNPSRTAAENKPSRVDAIHSLIKSFDPRLDWDEYFMSLAILVSARSPCSRLQTGCVLVSAGAEPNRVLATGYNGFLPGAPHHSRILKLYGTPHILIEDGKAGSDANIVNIGGKQYMSLENASDEFIKSKIIPLDGNPHEYSTVHAEQNAVAHAARKGIAVSGSTAYLLYFPCLNCTKVMVAAGIKEIKYHCDYDNGPNVNTLTLDLLKDAGIPILKI